MIPYLIISIKEFKNIICCKYSFLRYLFVLFWYFILTLVCYGIYYYQLWNFEGVFGSHLWEENYFWDISISASVLSGLIIFMTTYVFKAIFIGINSELTGEEEMKEEYKNNICILIACHNSNEVIDSTLRSIIKHFNGEQVYVCDNNKHKELMGNEKLTKSICEKYNVNYNYINIPNKTNSIRTVLEKIKDKYKYSILLDDDTLLGEKFCLKEDWFLKDERLAGIAFGIRMKDRSNIINRLVDYGYLLFSYNKYVQNLATNKFICGIGGIWKSKIIYDILKINPADGSILPFGEDGWNGLIARLNGYRIKQDMQNFVESYCPTNIFYTPKDFLLNRKCISGYDSSNLWKQRSLRWYRSSILRIIPEIYTIITYNAYVDGDSLFKIILRNIYYRAIIWWSLTLIYFSAIMPLLLVNYAYDPLRYFFIHSSLIFMSILSNIFIKYIIFRNRSDLHVGFDVILLSPFFRMYISLMRAVGFLGTMLYYLPFKSSLRIFSCHKIKKELIEKENNEIELVIVKPKQEKNKIEL